MTITTRRKNGKIKPTPSDNDVIVIIVIPQKRTEDLPYCKKVVKPDRKADELARRQSKLLELFPFDENDTDDGDNGTMDLSLIPVKKEM